MYSATASVRELLPIFRKSLTMIKVLAVFVSLAAFTGAAAAQDVVGIENCSAEKVLERRTGCLQSNVNYLYQLIGKRAAEAQQKLDAANQKLDAANGEIAALKAMIAKLQASVIDLQAAAKKAADPKPK
jgi:ABC-type transport system involved in cytochrome c biogenesis permease subunit